MKLIVLLVMLTCNCASEQLPTQDSYGIVITYQQCDDKNICKLITEHKK